MENTQTDTQSASTGDVALLLKGVDQLRANSDRMSTEDDLEKLERSDKEKREEIRFQFNQYMAHTTPNFEEFQQMMGAFLQYQGHQDEKMSVRIFLAGAPPRE